MVATRTETARPKRITDAAAAAAGGATRADTEDESSQDEEDDEEVETSMSTSMSSNGSAGRSDEDDDESVSPMHASPCEPETAATVGAACFAVTRERTAVLGWWQLRCANETRNKEKKKGLHARTIEIMETKTS